MNNTKNQKGGNIENLDDKKKEKLKRFDSWHDFGHPHGNRFAPGGLELNETKVALSDGKAPPSVSFPLPLDPSGELVLSMNNNRLYRANKKNKDNTAVVKYQYQNDNCSTKVRMRSVSYERLATAALDSCALENAWTKDNMLTWDKIYDRDPSIWDAINKKWDPNANFNYSDILIIADGSDDKKSYASTLRKPTAENQKKRNIVGNFIINYMFPDYQGNEPVAITFDAASGKVTKVFSGMGQVKALITPQNISDSATTQLDPFSAFKEFGHKRTEFLFPQREGETTWTAKSQYYSKNWCKIEYENVDFNTNSPNGFRIKISWWNQLIPNPSIVASFTIDYATLGYSNPKNKSGSAASGPSAPYLRGLIETIIDKGKVDALRILNNDTSLQPDSSTIIPLYEMVSTIYNSLTGPSISDTDEGAKQKITGLLLDLKRAGDYEQANAATWAKDFDPSLKVILSTGDVLCSTYSRSMGQSCILQGIGPSSGQGADAIALFRFPTTGINSSLPEDYDKVKSFFDSMEESMRKLTDLSRKGEKYTKATLTAAELSDTLQRLSKNGQLNYNIPPFNQKNPNLDQQDQSTMTIMATNICNSLLKLKYAQVYSSLSPSQEDIADSEKGEQETIKYEEIKEYIKELLVVKQDILSAIRNTTSTGADDGDDMEVEGDKPSRTKPSAWNEFHKNVALELGITVDAAVQKTNEINQLIKLQYLIEAGSPVTDKIISKDISRENIQSFFDDGERRGPKKGPYFPLYKKPNDLQKNVNNFLKSIGLDIALFFKVFSNFMKFLSAIPSDLAKVQKYLDKYEKQSLSVLGKQYNDDSNAKKIFEAIAKFIPDCLSYFDIIRNKTIEENELIPDARRRSRIIEAQIKKKLEVKNSYTSPLPLAPVFITFLTDKLNILLTATNSNSSNSATVSSSFNWGGGNKIKQKGGSVQEKFMTVLELLQNVSSQCDGFITDGISLNFTSTSGELRNTLDVNFEQCQSSGKLPKEHNQQVIKYQIYSILFNIYKSLNRFYNATASFVDENNNEQISQPSWQDLGATLLSLNQQINVLTNKPEYTTFINSVAFATRPQIPIRDYIDGLFKWVENAAKEIKIAGKLANFPGERTSPRFTPENCGNNSGLSTACRKLNELWNTLANNQQSSTTTLNTVNAVKGLSTLEEFINKFFESDTIINLKNAFYEQTLISCMYSSQSLIGNDAIRMANIKEFEDDIIDMWNEALYDNLDLDENPLEWNWKDSDGYTIINFTEKNVEKDVFSLINFIGSMLTKGNFIYTLACMQNVLLLNNNTFNPYVSIYSKHTVNPLYGQIECFLGRDCINKYKDLPFYTSDGIQNMLQLIKQQRFQNLSNRSNLDQLIKLTSPLLYIVETIEENSFMLTLHQPREGKRPKTIVDGCPQPLREGGYRKKKTRRRKKQKYKTIRRRKKYRKRTLKRKKRKKKTRFKK